MARKRVLISRPSPTRPEPDDLKEETWKEWSRSTLIRHWFIVGSMCFSSFTSLEILRYDLDFELELVLILLLIEIILDIKIYLYLWGSKGIWNYEDEYGE